MNKSVKIIMALAIAIGFPLTGYIYLSKMRDDNIKMPRKYFYDTVVEYRNKGILKYDTIWHKVKFDNLLNHNSENISNEKYYGKVAIVDFFFTRCKSFCPTLTSNMKLLQKAFAKSSKHINFISFSVDPEFDNSKILQNYSTKYSNNYFNWDFLTGSTKEIYRLAYEEFHVSVDKDNYQELIHTDKFILLDKKNVIRGYYGGQDSLELKRLANDAALLILEKEKK